MSDKSNRSASSVPHGSKKTKPSWRKINKCRADVLLLNQQLASSRSEAQALIMAGQVFYGEQRIEKAGLRLREDVVLRVARRLRYVSRGGLKLEHAVTTFAADGLLLLGKHCVDVGASTGGFTDCLLQHGVASVCAIDVGYGQLHPKLRHDPRVDVRERTNARHLRGSDFDHPIDLVVVDASFIGIGKLMSAIASMLSAGGELIALIKPQFEVGKQQASRCKGVISDPALRRQAIAKATADIEAAGFVTIASSDSPLRGPKGNLEHLLYTRCAP